MLGAHVTCSEIVPVLNFGTKSAVTGVISRDETIAWDIVCWKGVSELGE